MEQGEVNAADLQTALRRIVPFLTDANLDPAGQGAQLKHVWVSVDGGEVRMTTSNGYHVAQTWFEADWPNGGWVLDGEACTQLAQTADSMMTGDLPLEVTDTAIKINDMTVPVRGLTWIPYANVTDPVFAGIVASAIFSRVELMKFIRPKGAVLGITLRDGKCFGVRKLEKLTDERNSEERIPTQLVTGDGQAAFDRDRLKKAVGTFGSWVTLKLQDSSNKAVIFEGLDHWHVLMPWSEFPIISALGRDERVALEWAADMIAAIQKEKVRAIVDIREGRMVIKWDPEPERTEVRSSKDGAVAEVGNDTERSPVPPGQASGHSDVDQQSAGS